MKYVTENETEMIRVVKDKNFSTVSNECFQRDDLSWKAKGIMIYVLTLPNDWKINKIELMNHATDGRDSFNKGWKELELAGYIETIQIRNDKGVIRGVKYVIREHSNLPFTEKPNTDNPDTGLPFTGLPYTDNPPLLNTKDTNNLNKLNTKDIKDNVTIVPSASKVKYENEIKIVVDHYNQSMGTRKGYTEKTLVKDLTKIFKEGYTTDNVKDVLNYKIHEWINNKEMKKHLVPGTLFRFSNFEKYLDQVMLANQPSNVYNQKKYQQPQQQVTSKEVIKSQPDHNGFDGTNLNEDMLLKGIDKDTLLTYYNIQLNVTGKQFIYDRKPMTFQEFKNFIEFI